MIMYIFLSVTGALIAFSFLLRHRINAFHISFQSNLHIGSSCRYRFGNDYRLGTVYYIDTWHVILLDSVSRERFDVSLDQIRPA